MFEYMLGYASNTLSFVRIGGFVFTHAGLMSVVMVLSQSFKDPVMPVIMVVLGNALVIAVEGVLVGIQVLRLEFYEIFSRFYEPKGKEFKPITINY
jgi:V/A-type H+-transporting ATPase subunit I